MRLLVRLLLGIAAIVAVCLTITTAVILRDTHARLEASTAASADRAAHALAALYWQELLWRDGLDRSLLLPLPEWRTLETARVIAPGICVTFTPKSKLTTPPLCSLAAEDFAPAPAWFGALYGRLYGPFPTERRPIDARQNVGEIVATADPGTALRLAWLEIALILRIATIIALAIGIGVALLVVRTLMPVPTIISAMRQLEAGEDARTIGRCGGAELGQIARAVDALAARLARTEAMRAALTRRLFQVQEDERRALARDLHDEFGQCLFAVGACAASIEAGAAADRPDLVADARAVSGLARRMRATLGDALVRLRSQDVDELGLEAALRGMILRADGAARAAVSLDVSGDLASVPRPIAIDLFRVAQECLTNAARHATASRVRLAVAARDGLVALDVEDDGGGEPDALQAGAGHGMAGIRERVAALGGDLVIARARAGIRIAATIPFIRPGSACSAAMPA